MTPDPTARLRLDVALDQLLNPEQQTLDRDRAAARAQLHALDADHLATIRELRSRHATATHHKNHAAMRRAIDDMTRAGHWHRTRRARLAAALAIDTAEIPPLLDRLVDAVTSTNGAGNGARGVHRSPLNSTAVEVIRDIRAATMQTVARIPSPAANYGCLVGRTNCQPCRPDRQPCDEFMGSMTDQWCPRCGWAQWAHTTFDLGTLLRAWRPDDVDAAADRAERWIVDARAIVTPARWTEGTRPCPACGNRHVWIDEDGARVRKAAIQVNLTEGYAACQAPACGAWWPRERFDLLAAALSQDDVAS